MEKQYEEQIKEIMGAGGWYGDIPDGYEDTAYARCRAAVEYYAGANLSGHFINVLRNIREKMSGPWKCRADFLLHCKAIIYHEEETLLVLEDPFSVVAARVHKDIEIPEEFQDAMLYVNMVVDLRDKSCSINRYPVKTNMQYREGGSK